MRPEINPLAPCPANGPCGANTIDTADTSGNVLLKPERALGLNLAYEHSFADNSQFTLEAYTRRISNKMGEAITLENVAWSALPRYVSRPANLGQARTSGIDLDLEVAMRDFVERAPKLTLRASVGLASSRVESLPGPDNRLDKQTPWNAKVGTTYAMQALPLKFNVNANWSPSVRARTSLAQRVTMPRRFALDAGATWAVTKDRRVIVNFKSHLPMTAQQVNEYITSAELVRQYVNTRKYNLLTVSLETKL